MVWAHTERAEAELRPGPGRPPGRRSIADLCDACKNLLEFFRAHEFSEDDRRIAEDGINEIRNAPFLDEIGLIICA